MPGIWCTRACHWLRTGASARLWDRISTRSKSFRSRYVAATKVPIGEMQNVVEFLLREKFIDNDIDATAISRPIFRWRDSQTLANKLGQHPSAVV